MCARFFAKSHRSEGMAAMSYFRLLEQMKDEDESEEVEMGDLLDGISTEIIARGLDRAIEIADVIIRDATNPQWVGCDVTKDLKSARKKLEYGGTLTESELNGVLLALDEMLGIFERGGTVTGFLAEEMQKKGLKF